MNNNHNYIIIPQLDANDDKALVTDLIFDSFSSINEGDVIATIESTKASFEITSDYTGYIYFMCKLQDEIKVGEKIALVMDDLEELKKVIDKNKNDSLQKSTHNKPKLTKKAEMAIKKYNVDTKLIKQEGIVKEKDILSLVDAVDNKSEKRFTLKGNKKLGKELMVESKSEIPHSYIEVECNVTKLLQFISQKQKKSSKFISILGLITYATAKALKTNKMFNAYRLNNDIIIYNDINIGIVISNENELSLPIIHQADSLIPEKVIKEMLRIRMDLIKNKSKVDDFIDGTFTISALDHTDVTSFMPIIHPKQSAVLALPKAVDKLFLIEEKVELHKVINLGLSFDHSFLNATMANNFLSDIKEILEQYISKKAIEKKG